MTKSQECQTKDQISSERSDPRKVYASPRLTLFGKVAALTQGGSYVPSNDGNTSRMGASDRRLKQCIMEVGCHPLGFGMYLFDYKSEYRDRWGHGRQLGVMADEVEKVMPEAVSVHPDGYKMVDYAMLGISHQICRYCYPNQAP